MKYNGFELELIKMLFNKKVYDTIIRHAPMAILCHESVTLVYDIKQYYKDYPDTVNINLETFKTYFFCSRHPDINRDTKDFYNEVFVSLENTNTLPNKNIILNEIRKRKFEERVITMVNDHRDLKEYKNFIGNFKIQEDESKFPTYNSADLDGAMELIKPVPGLRWRLPALNSSIGGLKLGDFVVIASFPNAGKTSFLASEISHMAQNSTSDRPILWMNNERTYSNIVLRLYSALFNRSQEQILAHKKVYEEKYKEKIGDRIKIVDIRYASIYDIKNIIVQENPSVCVIDLLDHISGFNHENGPSDMRYKLLYQQFLNYATDYCPIIGTTQIQGEHEFEPYPPASALQHSRTAKQETPTTLLMIGQKRNMHDVRFLSTPRTKNGKNGFKTIVAVDFNCSRFKER